LIGIMTMSAVLDISGYCLRPMTLDDLAQVIKIEAHAYVYPWSKGIFEDCLRVGYLCRVFENAGRVQAYAIMSLMGGDCHVMNLTVDPEVQGQGVGRAVMRQLTEIARSYRVESMLLEARPSNAAALRLYTSEGFHEVGTRKAYYPAKWGREDAIILAKAL
jgi:ribosomal-protein-alanine N-acetyltransferase